MRPEDVPGGISLKIGETLRDLAKHVPANQLIVEIGAYQGRSTCFLAQGSLSGNQAKIISIDPWDQGTHPGPVKKKNINFLDPDNKYKYLKHLYQCGVQSIVTPIQGFSQKVQIPDIPIGLLWIDGAHDYKSVKLDIKRFCPKVIKGGYVIFDDYRAHCKGVDKAVDEIMHSKNWAWTISKPLVIGKKK